MPPFNHKFGAEEDKLVIEIVRKARKGCFNIKCKNPASKVCTRCGVAVYCSKECQATDWKKGGGSSHKMCCKTYRSNTSPDCWQGPPGQEFPACIGLWSVGYAKEEVALQSLRRRADAFLKEVKHNIGASEIGMVCIVVYNFHMPILQCSATVCDFKTRTNERVEYIVFEPIGEGSERIRRQIHPPFGPGDIPKEVRARVVEELKVFLQKVNENGLYASVFTYQRGLMWMSDDDFRNGPAKELKEANGGNALRLMPDQGYAMKAAMGL